MNTDLLQIIKQRRSIREFTDEPVSKIDVMTIIEAGSWAPSARNHQPWKFVIIHEVGLRALLAELTMYSTIIAQCQVLIGVYLDNELVRDNNLDLQSTGAAVQNMLLATEALGLGGVWLGEVMDCRDRISAELGIAAKYELAALLAIGYPAHRNQKSHRKNIHDFILKHIGG